MAGPENESAKKTEAAPPPDKGEASPALEWKVKAADTDTSSDIGSTSDPTVSNTSTHFGGPFQRAIELESGTLIGATYRVVRLIGKGGMGQVYLAEHVTLGTQCALKIMPSNQVTEKAWKRFQTEAKAIAGLDHPNLVRVSDLGIHENSLPYFAMEYVDGASLAQRLVEQGPLEQNAALDVLLQICEGIECAHKQGIVHRDLKPANIMLIADSNNLPHLKVKILDFGLAKLSQREAAEINLTATGEIFGSPLYMSPEQCSGETTDMRSDIYSLGCTVFECVIGQAPFTGETALAILNRKIFSETPSLTSASGGKAFSPDFEYIVDKMLEKDPKDRYQTIADLKADIQSVISGQPILARQESVSGQKATLGDWLRNRTIDRNNNMVVSSRSRTLAVINAVGIVILGSLTYAIYSNVPPRLPSHRSAVSPRVVGSAEVCLAVIRKAMADQANLNNADNPRNDRIRAERSAEYDRIIAESQAQLMDIGNAAIPACVKDLERSTTSSSVSRYVLAHNGAAAIDPVIRLLNQKPDRVSSEAELLFELGPQVGEKLCKAAGNRGDDRTGAIKALAQIGYDKRTYPTRFHRAILTEADRNSILDTLRAEQEPDFKKDLIDTLGYFRSPTPYTISTLSEILTKDESELVRKSAAETLCYMLEDAQYIDAVDIRDVLSHALWSDNQSESIKLDCIEALGKIRSGVDSNSLMALRAATKNQFKPVRQGALRALANLAVTNNQCLPDLKAALEDPDDSTVDAAISAVRDMGHEAVPVLPNLIKLANSNRDNTRSSAIKAICAVGAERTPEARAVILKTLDLRPISPNCNAIRVAIETLHTLGRPEAKEAIPALKRLVETDNPIVSTAAHGALQDIDL